MSNTIYELLVSKGHSVKSSGQDYLIHCLNPEHEDRNPSLRIDKLSGAFRCPVCGFKGNILKYYNILTTSVSLKVDNLLNKLKKVKAMLKGLDFPEGTTMYNRSFRNISADTLKRYEAFYTTSEPELEDRIVFPIRNVLGQIQAFIGRHTLSDVGAKYKVFPKHSPVNPYPINIDASLKYIVLVEGIFDMLNLSDKGLENSICCFGVDSLFKDTETKLLPYKIQGVEIIYILYDGDLAGRKAAKKLKTILDSAQLRSEILDLPDGVDPGSLSQEEVNSIKEFINEKSSNY